MLFGFGILPALFLALELYTGVAVVGIPMPYYVMLRRDKEFGPYWFTIFLHAYIMLVLGLANIAKTSS